MRLATTRVLAALIALAAPATCACAGEYYAGKSIDLLIGAPPGGGYDIYARALARHYGRHIPGQPTIVAKNMPGAASARAAGFISTLAPKDGTAIAALMPGGVVGPLLDEKAETLFDPTKVLYLGTANNGTRICVSRKDSKIKTFDDALTQKAAFGGVSTSDSTRGYGYMHKKTSGAKYDVVAGYSGTAEIALAMERGELDGVCAGIGQASNPSGPIGSATTRPICCCRWVSSRTRSSRAWASPRCSNTSATRTTAKWSS